MRHCAPRLSGENYAIDNSNSHQHRWFYYPQMKWDEALVFKVWRRHERFWIYAPELAGHCRQAEPAGPVGPADAVQ
eukprot:4090564-Pleurochrysis_carterae.AAC.2